MHRDAARQALVAGMVYFARETDCVLVAEGIETEVERRILSQLGVNFGQGYLFGRPVPATRGGALPLTKPPRAAAYMWGW